jgi:kynureninase
VNVTGKPDDPAIYLCGNSLGLQPRRTFKRIEEHLSVWATKGVYGHFYKHQGEAPPAFLDADDAAAEKMAPLVGARKDEVAVMETLTANLHFLMSSFYRPTKEKYKIILEGKAFPSDQVGPSTSTIGPLHTAHCLGICYLCYDDIASYPIVDTSVEFT